MRDGCGLDVGCFRSANNWVVAVLPSSESSYLPSSSASKPLFFIAALTTSSLPHTHTHTAAEILSAVGLMIDKKRKQSVESQPARVFDIRCTVDDFIPQ